MDEIISNLRKDWLDEEFNILSDEAADEIEQLRAELESLRADAERYQFIEGHWSSADIKFNKDQSFKSMSVTFKGAQLSDEANRANFRKYIDAARKGE